MKVPFAPIETSPSGTSEPQSIFPSTIQNTTGVAGFNQISSLPNQQENRQQRYASLFPGDVLGEEIAANQQTEPVTLVG